MARTLRRAAPMYADPAEVREVAAHLEQALLQCRDVGHLWEPWTGSWSDEDFCYYRTLRCGRCETERSQTLSDRGAVLTNSYSYPEGYLIPGLGRIAGEAKDMLRLASVSRGFQPKKKRSTNRKGKAA